jgi:hypothetical protein
MGEFYTNTSHTRLLWLVLRLSFSLIVSAINSHFKDEQASLYPQKISLDDTKPIVKNGFS